MKTMSEIVSELEKGFNAINERFYNNELAKPLITVQTGRRTVLGWCSAKERWENNGEAFYEINVVAENLGRTKDELIATLMHECVHLYNAQHGVSDCNAAQYHNKHFKNIAESHGLNVEKMKNRGYASTSLNEEGKKFCSTLDIDIDAFRMLKEKASNSYRKPITFQCSCGKRLRYHNSNLNVYCGECKGKFEPVSDIAKIENETENTEN